MIITRKLRSCILKMCIRDRNNTALAIVRPPMIYGKNSKGNFKMLVKLADKVPVFPNVKNERSMIYVENLAEFLCLLVESQKSGVFLPQNASCVTTAQMVAAIATAKGKNVHLCNWMNPFVALAKKMPGKIGGMAGKAFGSMVIEKELSLIHISYIMMFVGYFSRAVRYCKSAENRNYYACLPLIIYVVSVSYTHLRIFQIYVCRKGAY